MLQPFGSNLTHAVYLDGGIGIGLQSADEHLMALAHLASRVLGLPAPVTLWSDQGTATLEQSYEPQPVPAFPRDSSLTELHVRASFIAGRIEALKHFDLLAIMLAASLRSAHPAHSRLPERLFLFVSERESWQALTRLYPQLIGWVVGESVVKGTRALIAAWGRRLHVFQILSWAASTSECLTLASTPCHLVRLPPHYAEDLPGDWRDAGALPALHAARHDKSKSPPPAPHNALHIARQAPEPRKDHPDAAYHTDQWHVDRHYHSPGVYYQVEKQLGHPDIRAWPQLEQSYRR